MLILRLFGELLPLLAFGYLIGRCKPGLSSHIAPLLIDFGVPVSLTGLLLKSGLDWLLFEALAMALLAIGFLIAAIRTCPKLRSHIGSRSLLLGSVFGNSGYFGIPIALALFPSQSLSFSIGYDLGATLPDNAFVINMITEVTTGFGSSGSSTILIKLGSGSTDNSIGNDTSYTTLSQDKLIKQTFTDSTTGMRKASGNTNIYAEIKTAVMDAGVANYYIEYINYIFD